MEDLGLVTAGGWDSFTLAILFASVVVLVIWAANEILGGDDDDF